MNDLLCQKLKMANTYHQIYIQTVFAVKYREAVIEEEWRSKLLGVIGNLINESGCKTIIVNGVEDHIHCLLALKPTISISELMKTIKAKSSKYINDNQLTKSKFSWQEGYGAFSYSQSQIDSVNTFKIKKRIIKSKLSKKNICNFWINSKSLLMKNIFSMT